MIDYSPHSKYTAQKIQDKVTRGSYYYSMFRLEIQNIEHLKKIIKKLDARYHLSLSSRQRNYRIKHNVPVADLIIQKLLGADEWLCVLLIKAPNSYKHAHNIHEEEVYPSEHYLVADKIHELKSNAWSREKEQQDINLIQKNFKDLELLHFVLNKPFLSLDFGKHEVELVRLSNKKYANNQDKFYRTPSRSYTWTWRFNKSTVEKSRKELTSIINRIISQPQGKALYDLRQWQSHFNTYAVFRGNRQQAGRLYTFGKKFYFSRSRRLWDDSDLPSLHLKIVPRYQTYADSVEEYDLRRYVFELCRVELPREISKKLDQNLVGNFIEANL